MMVVRHGFMIVGGPLGGKTTAYRVLASALEKIHEKVTKINHLAVHSPALCDQNTLTNVQRPGIAGAHLTPFATPPVRLFNLIGNIILCHDSISVKEGNLELT
jgi:ribosomal protein S7